MTDAEDPRTGLETPTPPDPTRVIDIPELAEPIAAAADEIGSHRAIVGLWADRLLAADPDLDPADAVRQATDLLRSEIAEHGIG